MPNNYNERASLCDPGHLLKKYAVPFLSVDPHCKYENHYRWHTQNILNEKEERKTEKQIRN